MKNHKTVLIQHEGKFMYEANVDEKIAPLVLAVWKAGIETEFSCEDCEEKHLAYIQFLPDELIKFLNKVQVPWKEIGVDDEDASFPFPFIDCEYACYPCWSSMEQKTFLMTTFLFPLKFIDYFVMALTDREAAKTFLKSLLKKRPIH